MSVPDIVVTQRHALSPERARSAAQEVADQMVAEFDMRAQWDGDVLSFQRSGVSGRLALQGDEAQLEITLGAMLKMLAPAIEEKVSRNMAKVFA